MTEAWANPKKSEIDDIAAALFAFTKAGIGFSWLTPNALTLHLPTGKTIHIRAEFLGDRALDSRGDLRPEDAVRLAVEGGP